MNIDPVKQGGLSFPAATISNSPLPKEKENLWQKFMPSFPNIKLSNPLKDKIKVPSKPIGLTLPSKQDLENQPLFQTAISYLKNDKINKRTFVPFKEKDISDLYTQAEDDSSIEKLEQSLIEKMLKKSEGFCVGEVHDETGGKYFLMRNMKTLYEKGVRVIGIETITLNHQQLLDDYQHLLNECRNNPNNNELQKKFNKKQEKLNQFLKSMENTAFPTKDENCRIRHVIETALKNNIRVIAINYDYHQVSTSTYDESKGEIFYTEIRQPMMNYIAEKAVRQAQTILKPGEKFVCLMGDAHLSRNETGGKDEKGNYITPGVADLLQVPAITFNGDFSSNKTKMSVKIQQTGSELIPTPGAIEVNYAAKQAKNMGKLDIFSWFNKKNTVV